MRRVTTASIVVATALLLVAAPFPIVAEFVNAQTSLPDLVQRVKPSVAWVIAQSDTGKGCGSAFAVDASGLLVTALHVVDRANSVSVQFPVSNPTLADVVAVDIKSDLAILRIAQQVPVSLPIADTIRPGQDAIIIGYPLCSGPDPTVTKGIVSGLNRATSLGAGQAGNLIQIDAAMNPGNSGGPVLTSDGAVIGVADQSQVWVLSKNLPGQSVNFAVPSDAVKALVVAAMDSSKPHNALTLPLQRAVTGQVHYKGSADIQGKVVKDVTCAPPPAGAIAISAVRGELKANGSLAIETALSLRTNPDEPPVEGLGHMAKYGTNVVQKFEKTGLELPPRDACISYRAQSGMNWGILGFIPLGFEVTYAVDYQMWSPEITGVPLPVLTQEPVPDQSSPDKPTVTWTTQPNGSQVRVALQIVVPTTTAQGSRVPVKVVSISAGGKTKTIHEDMHAAGEAVSVSTEDVPPLIIQVYVGGSMVKQITVPDTK